ncbi:MAG: hypothetical protein GQF41_1429 [Candidatus Rifleibacterium amylolyticum]|nr:MAG: hypothetical protein GQF41_1429 [Candidatus Rifleibacterium amylolyticum]
MNSCVDFKSDIFKPFLSDDAQVNPGRLGAELAWWLSRELAQKGVETSYPQYEDWGWYLEYVADDNEYWLCCGNVDGEDSLWRVYLDCKAKGFWGRNKAPVEGAFRLLGALAEILSATEGISDVRWQAGESA